MMILLFKLIMAFFFGGTRWRGDLQTPEVGQTTDLNTSAAFCPPRLYTLVTATFTFAARASGLTFSFRPSRGLRVLTAGGIFADCTASTAAAASAPLPAARLPI